MFYWSLPIKYQLHGKPKVTAVWVAIGISCKGCRWDSPKCCSGQSKAEPSWAVVLLTTPAHVSSIVRDFHTVTERNYLQLPFTKLFLHFKKPLLLTIYKYLTNVNSATETTWKGQILHLCYFKHKIGFMTAGLVRGGSSRLSDVPT